MLENGHSSFEERPNTSKKFKIIFAEEALKPKSVEISTLFFI